MKRYKQSECNEIANQCGNLIRNSGNDGTLNLKPYKDIVIDQFLPVSVAEGLLSAFPSSDDQSWERTNDAGIEIKACSTWTSEFDVPEGLVDILRIFNSAPILRAMSEALQIPKLMSDPYYSGGGLNNLNKTVYWMFMWMAIITMLAA